MGLSLLPPPPGCGPQEPSNVCQHCYLLLKNTPHPQARLAAPGTMSEVRRDSASSLQRKKPPWLKLDIPAAAPPATEEPSFLQVGPGQQGLWVHPAQRPDHDPVTQPLRRQAFLRSVSMPAETAYVPSPYHEPRRPVLQRQISITQTIRRYDAPLAAPGAGGTEAGIQGHLWVLRLGMGLGPFLSRHSPPSCSHVTSCSGD